MICIRRVGEADIYGRICRVSEAVEWALFPCSWLSSISRSSTALYVAARVGRCTRAAVTSTSLAQHMNIISASRKGHPYKQNVHAYRLRRVVQSIIVFTAIYRPTQLFQEQPVNTWCGVHESALHCRHTTCITADVYKLHTVVSVCLHTKCN